MVSTALVSARSSKKDRNKYNLSRADIAKKYKERLLKNAKKSNILISEAALSSRPQESNYSIEQAELLIRGMQLTGTRSDSDWIDRVIKDVTVDHVHLNNAILYKEQITHK